MRIGRRFIIIACILLPLATGCQSSNKSNTKAPSNSPKLGDEFNAANLVHGTNRLLEQAYVDIVSVSGNAAQNTTDTAIREDALRWRIWATSRIDAIRTIDDPRLRFTALWTMATQFRVNSTEGPGQTRFGPVQKYFTDFAQAAEQSVLQLAYESFPDQVVNSAKPEIEQIAKTAGISGWVAPEELGKRAGKSSRDPISQILSIPLSPIAGLQGVGDTPTAINNFTDAARDMTRMVERFPERTRWQLELFMLEAQSSGAISGVLDESAAFRKESAAIREEIVSLGKIVEGLPEKVGTQTQAILKSAEAIQPQLGENLRQADTLTTSVQQAAGRIEHAANAVQAAASESKALTQELHKPKPEPKPGEAEKKDDFTAENVAQAAHEVRTAAAEIRLLVADLHTPTSMPALAQTSQHLDTLINRITWSAAALILLAFACSLAYLLLARKLRPAKGA